MIYTLREIENLAEEGRLRIVVDLDAEASALLGRAVHGVTVEQDWEAGTTAVRFADGSSVIIDGRDVRVDQ